MLFPLGKVLYPSVRLGMTNMRDFHGDDN